ncbi:snustorr snarlik isoform X2 [Rhodnius prolixus]|uniref:Secreted protein n=1 Tax=Rhodnius prolixus TaxID=13249 RepID=T1HTQ2_RHOPR
MRVNVMKILLLIICTGVCHGLFVPEQLPTLLSFIYTNIPPVRKGTDSRIGLGFRLGPNADFQVLFELGPQQNTLPIGPNSSNTNANTNKRETDQDSQKNPTWLQLWKQQTTGMKTEVYEDEREEANNIPVVLDEDVINHLKQLYKEQPKVINNDNNTTNDTDRNNTTVET